MSQMQYQSILRQALSLKEAYQAQPWKYENSSEFIEAQFTACWNSGNER